MAEEAPKKPSLRIIGDLTNLPEIRDSIAALPQLPKLKALVNPEFRIPEARIPEPIEIPPHPSVRTTAEVKELNRQTATLVQTMLDLIAVTTAEAESTRASNRRIIRLAVATVILTAFVAALTLVLVLR